MYIQYAVYCESVATVAETNGSVKIENRENVELLNASEFLQMLATGLTIDYN